MLRPKESCGLFFLAVNTCTSPTDTHGNQQVAEDIQPKCAPNVHQIGMHHCTHVKPFALVAYCADKVSQGDAAQGKCNTCTASTDTQLQADYALASANNVAAVCMGHVCFEELLI